MSDMTELLGVADARWLARSGRGRAVREAAGLAAAEVAAAVGVDRATVHRWEHDERRPSGEAAVQYAALIRALERQATDTEEVGA